MSYRGDLEASQARIDALEKELADTKRELGEIKGEQALVVQSNEELALAKSAPQYSSFFGGPKAISVERSIEVELDGDDFIELIQLIIRHTGDPGTVSSMPGSATWAASSTGKNASTLQITITCLRGTTTIRVDHNLRTTGGVLFGVLGGAVGGNAMIHSGIWLSVAGAPLLAAAAVPAIGATAFFGCRAIFRKIARNKAKRAAKLLALVTTAVEKIATRKN